MVLDKAEIEAVIKEGLAVRTTEKEALGEVFTPPQMIEDLYDQFPASVWKSKTTTLLDPCTGTGNFPIYAFYRFMDGLSTAIPNAETRAKHILEKMIYMIELNKENVVTTKKLFHRIAPKCSINIREADFLASSGPSGLAIKGWPDAYTIVVGNPPYNAGGTKQEGEKRLHIAFTERGLKCLEPKGFLAYICPPNYRETDTPMNKLFQEGGGHFVFIKIYGAKETFKHFHIQGRVDAFLFQQGVGGKTTVQDEYNVITTQTLDLTRHIPNFAFSIFQKLYDAVDQYGPVEGYRTTELSTIKKDTFGCGSHKLLHLITADGRRVYKTKQKHSLESVPKLLINGLGVPYVYYDKGNYGPSQSPVVIERPSAPVVAFVESPLFQCVAWGLRITGNNNLPYLLDAVPEFPKGRTAEDLMDALKLTKQERKFLEEECSVPEFKDKDLVEACQTRKQKKGGTRKRRV